MALMALKLQTKNRFRFLVQGLVEGFVLLLGGDSEIGSGNYVYPKTPKGTKSPEME